MKDRRKQLEQRVIGEVLGWHNRTPYDYERWLENPNALVAYLKRWDAAASALMTERNRIKKLRRDMNNSTSKEKP